jgi:hypothetical protein
MLTRLLAAVLATAAVVLRAAAAVLRHLAAVVLTRQARAPARPPARRAVAALAAAVAVLAIAAAGRALIGLGGPPPATRPPLPDAVITRAAAGDWHAARLGRDAQARRQLAAAARTPAAAAPSPSPPLSTTAQPSPTPSPVPSTNPAPSTSPSPAATSSSPPPPSGSPQAYAAGLLASYGWGQDQMGPCLVPLWNRESGWRWDATNPSSGAYGIPQALPGSKMASAGSDWLTNPDTQIRWGLGYIKGHYGTPCAAWAHEQAQGWY